MTTQLDAISEAIGSLRAEVRGLTESSRRADEHRANVHRRVDELVDEIGDLKSDMATVKRDVSDTKEVTEEVKRWKLMGMGALGVTGIAAGSLGALVAAYWNKIVAALTG